MCGDGVVSNGVMTNHPPTAVLISSSRASGVRAMKCPATLCHVGKFPMSLVGTDPGEPVSNDVE